MTASRRVSIHTSAGYDGWKHYLVSSSSYHADDSYTIRSKTIDGVEVWQKRSKDEVDLEGKLSDIIAELQRLAVDRADAEIERETEVGYYGGSDREVYFLITWVDITDEEALVTLDLLDAQRKAEQEARAAQAAQELARITREFPELVGK